MQLTASTFFNLVVWYCLVLLKLLFWLHFLKLTRIMTLHVAIARKTESVVTFGRQTYVDSSPIFVSCAWLTLV